MKISPRVHLLTQFVGSIALGLTISSIFVSSLREELDSQPFSNATDSSAPGANDHSRILPATRAQEGLLAIERNYSYPAIRMAQIEIATKESLAAYFHLYTQSPTLRVQWLATLSGVSPRTAGHYQRLAADLHDDSATTSAIVASGLCFGTFPNGTLRRSSLADMRGAFRRQLTEPTLDYSRLESNEPHIAKALALEVFSLPLDRYAPLNWAGAAYFRATREKPDFAPLSDLAAIDSPLAFQQCASFRSADGYRVASRGVTSTAFAAWMAKSLGAANNGWIEYSDLDTIILRWAVYSPDSLLQWIEKLDLPAAENTTLQGRVGEYIALTQWEILHTLSLYKHSAELLSGVVRGLCQIDPSIAKDFMEKGQATGQDITLQAGDHSLIASELSYEHPAAASAHYATFVSPRLLPHGAPKQDYDAMRASERVYNALVDISAETAMESADRLTESARAIALVQLYKSFLLKNDRASSEKALQRLRILDDKAFRSAVVQGYGMQVRWDILEGQEIEPELKTILQRTGTRIQGALLPTLTQ